MEIKFSMDGFRKNLSRNVQELKDVVERIINEDHYDNEDLVDAVNNIICGSNSLNCVYFSGGKDFTDLSDVCVEPIEV